MHCRLLSVYLFVLLSLLTFMGGQRVVTSQLLFRCLFAVDPLGAIVAVKFKCRKLFSVECKGRP